MGCYGKSALGVDIDDSGFCSIGGIALLSVERCFIKGFYSLNFFTLIAKHFGANFSEKTLNLLNQRDFDFLQMVLILKVRFVSS